MTSPPSGRGLLPQGAASEFSIEKAKSLLAEAGYPDGLDIELSTSNVTAGMLDMAQAWQQVVKPQASTSSSISSR